MSSRTVLILGALKEALGVRMPQEPQLPAWTSRMPKGGQWGLSLSSLPSMHGMHLQLGLERVYAPILGWLLQGCV